MYDAGPLQMRLQVNGQLAEFTQMAMLRLRSFSILLSSACLSFEKIHLFGELLNRKCKNSAYICNDKALSLSYGSLSDSVKEG